MYNVSSYLNAYVRSIFKQSFKDFKVLCINDGSTDDTLQHIRELTQNDARFTILTHENRGVYYNYKLALERVDTPYFSILDPDDWYAPNHLELLYQAIQKDDADLAKGSLVRNYPSQSSNHTSTASHDASIERLDHRNDTIRKDIQRGHHPARHNCGSQWISHLYKTDFVKKNAISFYTRDDGFEWDGDDIFLLSILLKQPKIVFCDDAHYHYLQRATSAVHQINPLRFTSTVKSRQIETQILNAAYRNGSLSKEDYLAIFSRFLIELSKHFRIYQKAKGFDPNAYVEALSEIVESADLCPSFSFVKDAKAHHHEKIIRQLSSPFLYAMDRIKAFTLGY